MKNNLIDREKMKKGLLKSLWEHEVDHALDSIEGMRPFIHATKFSGKYNYSEVVDAIGKLKFDEKYIPDDNKPFFITRCIKNYKQFFTVFFFDPPPFFRISCQINVYPKKNVSMAQYKAFLSELAQKLPSLEISKAEYALDIFCYDNLEVRNLHDVTSRTLYVPYVRDAKIIKSEKIQYTKNQNLCIRYGDEVKTYERGEDGDKEDDCWDEKDCNRVRLEVTLEKAKLNKKFGIKTIHDFIRNPKFYEIAYNRYQFKGFKNSKKLPALWEGYEQGIFHAHKAYATKEQMVKNIRQNMVDVPELIPLKAGINNAIEGFQW